MDTDLNSKSWSNLDTDSNRRSRLLMPCLGLTKKVFTVVCCAPRYLIYNATVFYDINTEIPI